MATLLLPKQTMRVRFPLPAPAEIHDKLFNNLYMNFHYLSYDFGIMRSNRIRGYFKMITCPKCNRPVAGRARRCGWCGESLVEDYFQLKPCEEKEVLYQASFGGIMAMIFGIIGSLCLMAVLFLQINGLCGWFERMPYMVFNQTWIVKTIILAVLCFTYLIQQLVLHGIRTSVWFDSVWLLISSAVGSLIFLEYLANGISAFYNTDVLFYLLEAGFVFIIFSSVFGILTDTKPIS